MDGPERIDDRPNYLQPPPTTHASPADMRLPGGPAVRWYFPGFAERFQLMGWRNLLFLPMALLIVGLAMLPWWHAWMWQFIIGWWKLWVFAVAVPLGAAAKTASTALRLRQDPFCIHCGYSVVGLPDGHNCPECGEPFNLKVTEEYRRDPHWFIERYRRRFDIPQPSAAFDARPTTRKSRDGT